MMRGDLRVRERRAIEAGRRGRKANDCSYS
jgi:hypothetical protein